MTQSLELRLPEFERHRAAALAGAWSDLLYVPGAGFASLLDPGLYRSSFVIVPSGGPAIRVSSFSIPAFGDMLCRLRLEALTRVRTEVLGSFFEPSRRGAVYTMSGNRKEGGAVTPPPDRPEWSYGGPSLSPHLGEVTGVRVLRERVSAMAGGARVSWTADRGLLLVGPGGRQSLMLALPAGDERAAFLPELGFYRALLDAEQPGRPGATVRELLGYGDWEAEMEIAVTTETLSFGGG